MCVVSGHVHVFGRQRERRRMRVSGKHLHCTKCRDGKCRD
jgi:hypothetical protein